jgi:TRAP-type C4-dicarboxylate transport system substrate-binding protein
MPTLIRMAGYQDEPSVHTRAMRLMIENLGAAAGSAIAVEFEPDIARRRRKVADLLDLVASGELDLCYFSSSYLTARVPALAALDIPFLFSDPDDTRRRLEGPLGACIRRDVAAGTPYVVLAFWDNGQRHISNARRPLRAPADCVGLRIRTVPSAGHHATFRALGMQPVTIDVADMVRAIAAGEVDAQENPLTNIRLFGLQRHHPYVTTTAHFHGVALVLCNAAAWARWPEPLRAGLADAVTAATAAQWRFSAEDDLACRAELTAQGVQIVDLDPEARAAFRNAVREVAAGQRAALPAGVADLLPPEAPC